MSNVVDITLRCQLQRSIPLAAKGQLPAQVRARHVGAVMRQRDEARTVAKLRLVDDMAEQAKRDLTAANVCHVCGKSLDAKRFCAWSPDFLIVTHGGCE